MALPPHEFWQRLEADGAVSDGPFSDFYPAALPDGRVLRLPVRVLPGDGTSAVASLICNQASFAVIDALVGAMADLATPFAPEVVVGVPTLGLPLAEGVARRLGHTRMVPLGTSRKFWYRDELSEPLSSITSPEQQKRLFLDPRMLPVLAGRRVVVVDDVVSSGRSMVAVLRLLRKAGVEPVAVVVAMQQSDRWRAPLAEGDPGWPGLVQGVVASPLLRLSAQGWLPAD